MERIYKGCNSEKEPREKQKRGEMPMCLDDREHEIGMFSPCAYCKRFQRWGFFCEAFPDGVPREYIAREKGHTEIDPRQVGETLFEPSDGFYRVFGDRIPKDFLKPWPKLYEER